MINNVFDCAVLNNGVKMPWLGLGVWKASDAEAEFAVKAAIRAGYRAIDTAAIYGNEAGVGKGIKESGVPREELFITTKVWNANQGYDTTLKAFEESMGRLGLDYLDLYLIHWPVKGKYKDTWRALERLYEEKKVRAIGVSNFHAHHLEDLMSEAKVKPMIDQVEFHPLLSQRDLRGFCKTNGIQFEAWSPLMQGQLDQPVIAEIANKHGKSPAQVVLRWDLQNGVVTIPKSVHENRIIENMNIFDFELTDEEMSQIDTLNRNQRFGSNPDNFNF